MQIFNFIILRLQELSIGAWVFFFLFGLMWTSSEGISVFGKNILGVLLVYACFHYVIRLISIGKIEAMYLQWSILLVLTLASIFFSVPGFLYRANRDTEIKKTDELSAAYTVLISKGAEVSRADIGKFYQRLVQIDANPKTIEYLNTLFAKGIISPNSKVIFNGKEDEEFGLFDLLIMHDIEYFRLMMQYNPKITYNQRLITSILSLEDEYDVTKNKLIDKTARENQYKTYLENKVKIVETLLQNKLKDSYDEIRANNVSSSLTVIKTPFLLIDKELSYFTYLADTYKGYEKSEDGHLNSFKRKALLQIRKLFEDEGFLTREVEMGKQFSIENFDTVRVDKIQITRDYIDSKQLVDNQAVEIIIKDGDTFRSVLIKLGDTYKTKNLSITFKGFDGDSGTSAKLLVDRI